MSAKQMGPSLDDFLKDEGVFEQAQAQAVKEVAAWQCAEATTEEPSASGDRPGRID